MNITRRRERPIEPGLWLLFSAGGVASAMLMPALLFLFGLAWPLGWIEPPAYEHLRAVESVEGAELGQDRLREVLLAIPVDPLRGSITLPDADDASRHAGNATSAGDAGER